MFEVIAKRLAELGYELGEGDAELVGFCRDKVENHIKNFTNLRAVPEGLFEVFIDRVCGEFLFLKLQSGQIGEDLGIKAISEGDVSVTFSDGAGMSALVDRLMNSGGGELICYRKIRW